MTVPKFPEWQRRRGRDKWLTIWEHIRREHGYVSFRRHKDTGEHRWCFYSYTSKSYRYTATLRELIIWWATERLNGNL